MEHQNDERVNVRDNSHTCEICATSLSSMSRYRGHICVHKTENPYNCKICGESFIMAVDLRAHMNLHRGKTRHGCSICGKIYSNAKDLVVHMRLHTGQDLSTCSICGHVSSNPWDLDRHMLCHGEKIHKCPTCKRRFARTDHLRSHMLTHTDAKSHGCGICGKKFRRAWDLRRHLPIHSSSNIHKCHLCTKSFVRVADLRAHASIHLKEACKKCPICGRSFKKSANFHAHVRTHIGEKRCQICGKRFLRSYDLRRHANIHTRQNKLDEKKWRDSQETRNKISNIFTCDICVSQFDRFSDLVKHIISHAGIEPEGLAYSKAEGHTGQKSGGPKSERFAKSRSNHNSYCCDTCGIYFSRYFSLRRHIGKHIRMKIDKPDHAVINNVFSQMCVGKSDDDPTVQQIKQKEYCCDTCGRDFARFSSLQSHVISHTEVDTIVSSHTKVNLSTDQKGYKTIKQKCVNHRTVNHVDDRTSFESNIKSKGSYKQRPISRRNMLKQNNITTYSCRICDKSFTKASSLRSHMVVHTKTGIYKCDICGIDNRGFSSLQKHIATHLEEKGHYCCICSSEFSRESELLDHMLVHTWENAPLLPFLE